MCLDSCRFIADGHLVSDGTKTSAHVESLLAQVKPFSPQTVVFSASMSDVVVRKVSEIGGANSVKVDLVASGFSKCRCTDCKLCPF